MNDGANDPVFTSDEIEDNTKLTVLAKSDGDEQSVNLYLEETDRFTGRYEGFVRLTDANGDGSAATDDPDTEAKEHLRQDWGLVVGSGAADNDTTDVDETIAILGVESGPVTIEYRDTDGRKRTLRIEIDRQPSDDPDQQPGQRNLER